MVSCCRKPSLVIHPHLTATSSTSFNLQVVVERGRVHSSMAHLYINGRLEQSISISFGWSLLNTNGTITCTIGNLHHHSHGARLVLTSLPGTSLEQRQAASIEHRNSLTWRMGPFFLCSGVLKQEHVRPSPSLCFYLSLYLHAHVHTQISRIYISGVSSLSVFPSFLKSSYQSSSDSSSQVSSSVSTLKSALKLRLLFSVHPGHTYTQHHHTQHQHQPLVFIDSTSMTISGTFGISISKVISVASSPSLC